jgi:Asp-tRNA(Asn)/Glu-tRNA(Gln) amidotransferase A subunit family amidase
MELERILGIRNGGDRKSDSHNANVITQSDLAEKLKVSQSQLARYKKLLELIPELQTAVESGQISATNASAILARLPEAEQKAIAEQIVGTDGKVSRQELEFYKNRVAELSARKPQTIEKIVEVESKETLRKLKRAEQSASDYKADYEREKQRTADKQREVLRLREELQDAKEQTKQANFSQKLIENAAFFMTGCGRFISEYGGLVWIVDHLEELPENERNGYIKAVNAARQIKSDLKSTMETIDVIALPTAPQTAFKIGQKLDDQVDMYQNDVYTVIANLTGLPAISFPCGKDENGLPIGAQLIAGAFNEQLLFDMAYTYETDVGGFAKPEL